MEEREGKVKKYEAFVDQKLKPDLVHAVSERDKVLEKQAIYSDLATSIKLLEQNNLKKIRTSVNLGSEVYAQAEVQVEEHTRQIAGIKAQIKLVGEGIRELMNLSGAKNQ